MSLACDADTPRPEPERPSAWFAAEVPKLIPSMRAYARAMAGSASRADDLVQDALLNAFRAHHQFVQGTNLKAWLFRILRNRFLTSIHRDRRMVDDPEDRLAGALTSAPEQESGIRYRELLEALQRLAPPYRDILVLLAAGNDYAEIAMISDLPLGTVKSRINRARNALLKILGPDLEWAARGEAAPQPRLDIAAKRIAATIARRVAPTPTANTRSGLLSIQARTGFLTALGPAAIS